MTVLQFPSRVWYETEPGKWASREPNRSDEKRRARTETHWPKDPLQVMREKDES